MCNVAALSFGHRMLGEREIRGRRVLEVGARDVNGSLRGYLEALGPAEYLGVDIEPGPGVDLLCDAETLSERFGPGRFDVVVATEVLEHVRDWRRVVEGLKSVLVPDGVLLITTRSLGFPYHGFPHDFWRYELDDMRAIFVDFTVESLEPDPYSQGVFLRARKPADHRPADLSGVSLHSMVTGGRVRDPGQVRPEASLRLRLIGWAKRSGLLRLLPARWKVAAGRRLLR